MLKDEIRIDRALLLEIKDTDAALILSDIYALQEDLFFEELISMDEPLMYTIKDMERDTGLSNSKQRKALSKLQESGYIQLGLKGCPPKRTIQLLKNGFDLDLEKVKAKKEKEKIVIHLT